MAVMTDIEIAQQAVPQPVTQIAAGLGIQEEELELYGPTKAKLSPVLFQRLKDQPDGRLILVTAITPTPAGEGKTTVSVGLADGLHQLGKNVVLALREPSLGPVFGVKGGAAGGGHAQVIPMEELNLHFTGDIHAVSAAGNLLAAMIDNHLQQGNALDLDPRRITWRRSVDMNDRALRSVVIGLGGKSNGVPREDGFDISVASEVMAILCLADGLTDLKRRLGAIVIGYNRSNQPVTAADLHAQGAMAALLKDALKPNLVQTLEHTPTLIHGGPFANIAHGCNSVTATRLALKLGDYVVTEAGFGADLGAEKFLDIKCRSAGLKPAACVVVCTIRALKHHGGVSRNALQQEDLAALERGLTNLQGHVENLSQRFGLPVVVAVNRFQADTEAELRLVEETCARQGVACARTEVWEKGGKGGEALAQRVLEAIETGENRFAPLYPDERPLREKIETVAREIYGAGAVEFGPGVVRELERLESFGFGRLPVCMAKTQYSFSDDPGKLGRPRGFTLSVRRVKVSAGAGFVVVYTGEIMTMPGLPRIPAAEQIDVDENGVISGLF